ncbi:MAG: hypothetical protein FWG74_09260 [Planctomycetes bacterium]|nr:hypothetical protein [Planctomycetota bacterium]
MPGADPKEAAATIVNLEGTWDELFPVEQARIVRMLVQRVDASTDGLTVTFRDKGIEAMAKMLADAPDDPANALPPPKTAPRAGGGFLEPEPFVPEGKQVFVPMRLMRRSGRKVVVSTPAAPMPAGQAEAQRALPEATPLALAVARGFRWRALLDSGEYATHRDLARCLGVTRPYISRMVRLTLLAPDIVEAIMDGREPSGLSVDRLSVEELPGEWGDQRKEFGFSEAG